MAKAGEKLPQFSKGDWIVHLHHGVGQVRGVVRRRIGGEKTPYYRVRTRDSVLFVPVNEIDGERLRPLASQREFKRAQKILKQPAEEMSDDHTERKRLIREVKADGSLESIARLVRNLTARRIAKKLNNTEERALRQLKRRLVREWSVCRELSVEEARGELNMLLHDTTPDEDE